MSSIAGIALLEGVLSAGQIGGAIALQNKTVTPTDEVQTIQADSGYAGLGIVTVEAASGGDVDTLDTMFNTGSTVNFTMTDDNENHTCYGFTGGLNVTLPSTITEVWGGAFDKMPIYSFSGPGVVTVNSYAFSQAYRLTTVSLPECTSIGEMAFYGGDSLTSIRLPKLQTLGESAFSGCGALADIYLGYDGVVSVSSTANSISSCGTGCTVHVPAVQLSAYQADANWTGAIAAALSEGVTVTLAGDYSEEIQE